MTHDAPPRHDAFTDEAIEQLVHRFYDRVRADPTLGPIFARRIEDWGPHLLRMRGFWTAVLRNEPTFHPGPKGPPPVLHRAIGELERAHFVRWLALFAETADEGLSPPLASEVLNKAQRIAQALSRHLPPSGPRPPLSP